MPFHTEGCSALHALCVITHHLPWYSPSWSATEAGRRCRIASPTP